MGASFTIEGWVKRSDVAQSREMFNKGANGLQLVVMNAGSGNQVWLREANVTTIARSAGGVAAGWLSRHRRDHERCRHREDPHRRGALTRCSSPRGQAIQDTAFPLTFGSTATSPATFDEFALYDGVLTAAQVHAHYVIGVPN